MRPILALMAASLMLCGCETAKAVDVGRIAQPPTRCMIPAKRLAVPLAGDDLRVKHVELMDDYVTETSKLRCMQSYARAFKSK